MEQNHLLVVLVVLDFLELVVLDFSHTQEDQTLLQNVVSWLETSLSKQTHVSFSNNLKRNNYKNLN